MLELQIYGTGEKFGSVTLSNKVRRGKAECCRIYYYICTIFMKFFKRFCCFFRVSVVPSLERLAMKPSTTGLARKLSCHRMTVKNCCRRCTCRVRRLCSIERQSQNFQSKWCVNTYVYYLTIRLILSESASMILTATTVITWRNWLPIFFDLLNQCLPS